MIACPVVSSVAAHHGGLGDRRVVDQRRLDLGGGDAMAGDVHHVVDPSEEPQVAVLVDLGPVAGEVAALVGTPVRLDVALRVTPDATEHRRATDG